MRRLQQGFFLVFWLIGLRIVSAESAVTRWTEIETGMGEMQLDGSLNYRVLLGGSELFGLLGLRPGVVHVIDVDETGSARSGWRFLGLQTSLVPSGRNVLRWKSLTGAVVDFERAAIGPAFSHAGSGQWLIRKTSEEGCTIHSPEGVSWYYEAGRLVGIEHPVLGRLRVSTQGAWVTRIELSESGDETLALLEAGYSDGRRLLKLRVGDQTEQEFTWEGTELVAWRSADGELVRWSYRGGLLSQISEPNGRRREIRWRANKGFGRGDSRWALPVHLAAVDDVNYGYTLTRRGFVLTRETRRAGDFGGGVVSVWTRFNPLRYRLDQWAGGELLIVTFRKHSPGRGAVERIETASGDALEEYRYDNEGRLIGVRKLGEPSLVFKYDDLGRLTEVEGELGQ